MKRFALVYTLALIMAPLAGCPTASVTTPPAATAPGYLSSEDQKLGESLAAVNAFVNQEKVNYAAMPAVQQGREKTALNALIAATNIANAAYTAFHGGSGTLQQAQTAYAQAQQAQSALATAKGVQ